MSTGRLEHTNFTVSNPIRTADLLCSLFGWHIRWQGASKMNGYTVHVGTDDAYLALYNYAESGPRQQTSYASYGAVNHIGIVVDDLAAAEQRVLQAGLTPHSHASYEPGQRFYFNDHDDIEFEVISYA
jgi:catechol 2,3-dioxygenase-like lactoylglutathione lyase family enzyme